MLLQIIYYMLQDTNKTLNVAKPAETGEGELKMPGILTDEWMSGNASSQQRIV